MGGKGVADLYAGAALVLWVDAPVTGAFLDALLGDAGVAVRDAGHPGAVPLLVDAAVATGHGHVFGLAGQGFGSDNRHRWARPPDALRTYLPKVFDPACWLLDDGALAAVLGDDAPAHVRARAQALCPWMAGRRVAADLARAAGAGLPEAGPGGPLAGSCPDPAPDAATVRTRVLENAWVTSVAPDLPGLADPAWLADDLVRVEAGYREAVQGSRWRSVFPGHALLGPLLAGRDVDVLGRAFARWFQVEDRIPADVTALRTSLLGRLPRDEQGR